MNIDSLSALAKASMEAISATLVASVSSFTFDLHVHDIWAIAFFGLIGMYVPFRAFRIIVDGKRQPA